MSDPTTMGTAIANEITTAEAALAGTETDAQIRLAMMIAMSAGILPNVDLTTARVALQLDNLKGDGSSQLPRDVRVTLPTTLALDTGAFGTYLLTFNNRENYAVYLLNFRKAYNAPISATLDRLAGSVAVGLEYVVNTATDTTVRLSVNMPTATHQHNFAAFTAVVMNDANGRVAATTWEAIDRADPWTFPGYSPIVLGVQDQDVVIDATGALKIKGAAVETRWPTWDEVTEKPTAFPVEAHTHPISEVTNLQSTLDTMATDADVVKLTGDQVVDGTKTFRNSLLVDAADGGAAFRYLRVQRIGTDASTYQAGVDLLDNGVSRFSMVKDGVLATVLNFRETDIRSNVPLAVGLVVPSEQLDVDGRIRARTVDNAAGDFVTASVDGVLQKRTAAETLSDIGAAASSHTHLWADITDAPSEFTPGAHTHGNITDAGAIGTTSNLVVTTGTSGVLTTLSRSGIDSRATFPPDSHTHSTSDITNLSSYTGFDARYYTESESNNRYLQLTGGTLSGLTTFSVGDSPGARFTNATYGSFLDIGGWTTTPTNARVTTSNGNLHLDDADDGVTARHIYLNHYHAGDIHMEGGGQVLMGGPLTVVADVTAQLTVRRSSTGNRAELLSGATSNELFLRNSLNDGTVDGSIIIDGDANEVYWRPGDTVSSRREMWHSGNLPIWRSSAQAASLTYDVAYSFSVGSMYLLTVRVNTSTASRSATYIITIGGGSASQQVFALQGEQGYGTDYFTSVVPNGTGWTFNMTTKAYTHTFSWAIMRLYY